jgi:hypothetical protein
MRRDFSGRPSRAAFLMAKEVQRGLDHDIWRRLVVHAMLGRPEKAKPDAELALACSIILRRQTPQHFAIAVVAAASQWVIYSILPGIYGLILAIAASFAVLIQTAAAVLVPRSERKNAISIFRSEEIPDSSLPLESWLPYSSVCRKDSRLADSDAGLYISLVFLAAIIAARFGTPIAYFSLPLGAIFAFGAFRIGWARQRIGTPFWRKPRRRTELR